jgi:hypothetical protein
VKGILLLDELHALGVAFVSLTEGIDATNRQDDFSSMFWGRLPSSSDRGFEKG